MCEASGGPGSHFLSPLTPRLPPSVALFNPQCCSALTFLTKSSPSLSLPLHSSLFSAFLFHFKLLFYSNLILLLSTTCFFSPQRATIRPPPCLGLRPRHPIHIAFFFMVFPIFVCALNPSPASTLCTIAPPTSHPPEPPPAEQPGRAPTWCTTTCWPTWTGPAWTRRAAAAACRGRSSPPTCRRTRTMTPSGRATVTGWARCRARAASPTRTKETWLYCHAAL